MKISWKFVLIIFVVLLILFYTVPKGLNLIAGVIDKLSPFKALYNNLKKDYDELEKKNEDYRVTIVERDSINKLLGDSLRIAETLSTTSEVEKKKALERIDTLLGENLSLSDKIKYLKGKVDYLSELLSDSQRVSGTGRVVNWKSFSDDWIDIKFKPEPIDTTKDPWEINFGLNYDFTFSLGEVRISALDEVNNRRTIASVWLQSIKNIEVRKYLGDFELKETYIKPKKRMWYWWNPSIHLRWSPLYGGWEGLGFSTCSWGRDKQGSDVLVYCPVVGLIINLDEIGFDIGGTVNLGYFVPLITNLNLGVGFDPFITRKVYLTLGCVI